MVNCPTLRNLLQGQICEENFAGLGSTAYIFLKKDLAKPLAHKGPIYQLTADAFKSQRGLFKVELKEEANSITGESQKKRGGFKQTTNLVVEVVNDQTAELLRALNNLDWCLIIPDGDKFQIMYNETNKMSIDAGGLKTETGAASSDDRNTTIAVSLANCLYPNTFVELPEGMTIEDFYVGDDFDATLNAGGAGNVDVTGDVDGQFFFIADEDSFGTVTAKKVSDSSAVTSGSVVGAGIKVTLTATPKTSAYKFERWSNGSTKPEITVTTNGTNEHYIAYFAQVKTT